MELGLQKGVAGSLLGNSELLFAAQCSLSLSSASASHHEAHSSQPVQTKFFNVTKEELDTPKCIFLKLSAEPRHDNQFLK